MGRKACAVISHRHRCIYIKVPKCASTSVLAWFAAHGAGRHSFRPAWHGGPMSKRIPAVAHAMNLYPGYFTFTFLRNPYERFVSLWLDLRRVARRRRGGALPAGFGTLREFAELCAELLGDFPPCWGAEALRAFRARQRREYGAGRVRLGDLGWSADHLWPQTAFLPDCNPSRLLGVPRSSARPLSFIGSVERMDEDFARLADLLDLPAAPLPRRNASGTDRRGRYARHYDRATRRLVETMYAPDLEFTGCGFDDGRTAVTVAACPPVTPASLAGCQPEGRKPLRTLPARAWREIWSRSAGLEARILRRPAVRRAVSPLAARRGPG